VARATMAAVWIPQFLLLRRVTYPISDLEGLIARAGFTIEHVDRWTGTNFRLVHAGRAPFSKQTGGLTPQRETLSNEAPANNASSREVHVR